MSSTAASLRKGEPGGGRCSWCPAWSLLTGQVQGHVIDDVRVAFSTSVPCVLKNSVPTPWACLLQTMTASGCPQAFPCSASISLSRSCLPLNRTGVISETRCNVSVAKEQPAPVRAGLPCSPTGHNSEIQLSPWSSERAPECIFQLSKLLLILTLQ